MYPFKQRKINGNLIRKFSKDVSSSKLAWHRDHSDRAVSVVEGIDWLLQIDNNVPVLMEVGIQYYIPKNTYHRVIKGSTDLVLEINETSSAVREYIRKLIGTEIKTYAEGRKPHDRSRKTRKNDSTKYRRRQGKKEAEHPEETEDTAVLGKGILFKGPKMKTPSQLSYGLDYSGGGMEEMKVTKTQLKKMVKEATRHVVKEVNDRDYQDVVDGIIIKFYEKAHDFEQYQPLSLEELNAEEYDVVEFFSPPEFERVSVSSAPVLHLNRELQADVESYALESQMEGKKQKKDSKVINEGIMTVQPMIYGGVEIVVDGVEKNIGELVADLLDAGDDEIFVGGKDLRSLDRLINSWATGVGGDMTRWDSDIFSSNYNVDNDRVVKLWAKRYNHKIEEIEMSRDGEW